MRRLFAATVPIAALACVSVSITAANSCRADVINSWQGASASAVAAGNTVAHTGATVSATTSGSTSATSLGSLGQPVTIAYASDAGASASENASNLLTASTSLYEGVTGRLTAPITPNDPVQATASWNNDLLTVHGPAGVPLPSSVVLQFKIDVNPAAQLQIGNGNSLVVQINGQDHYLSTNGDGTIAMQPPGTDGSTQAHQTGTFDIKLALHSNGMSDPFSVGVSSSQTVQSIVMPVNLPSSSISLSVTGVTLADGTPLSAAGYSASFSSGMTLPPQPVPEPTTFVVWALLTGAVVTIRHRAPSTKIRR